MNPLRKFYALIQPGKRWRWLVLVILAVIVGVFEAVGAVLIFGLLALIINPGTDFVVPAVGDLTTRFPNVNQDDLFLFASLFTAIFFLIRALTYLLQTYLQQRVAHNTGVLLATRLVQGYLEMPYSFHLRRNSAELIRNAYASVFEVVGSVFVPVVTLASETLLVLGILVVLMLSAPVATLLAFAALLPMVLIVLRLVQPRLMALGKASQEMYGQNLQWLQQGLEGIRDIRILGRERFFRDRFSESRASLARTFYLRHTFTDLPRIALETLLIIFVLAFLAFTVARGDSIQSTLAVLGLFAYAALRMLPSINRIVANLNSLNFTSAAVDNIHNDLLLIEAERQKIPTNLPAVILHREISLADVTFTYPGTSEAVLKNVSLRIPRGESLGVVGPTGGGKTTLIDVILGLLPPSSGTVRVDGIDIHSNLRAWHSNLGVVPQSIFLLDDSLRRNIAFGLEDQEIDDARVADAVAMAQLEDFVEGLPDGLETVVGERGVRLSGGQRQRVAIARALYRQPTVLVLDEGTSALDNETERQLLADLERLHGEKTVITVAHRLTSVRSCDRILVVSKGGVEVTNSYEQIVRRSAELGPRAS